MRWDWTKKQGQRSHHSPALPRGSLRGVIPYNYWEIKGHPNVACINKNGTSSRISWTDTDPEKPSALSSWLLPLLPSAQAGSGLYLCDPEVTSPTYLPPLCTKLCPLPIAKLLVKLGLKLLIFRTSAQTAHIAPVMRRKTGSMR